MCFILAYLSINEQHTCKLSEQDHQLSIGRLSYLAKPEAVQANSLISKLTLLTLHFPRLRIIWSRSLHASADIFRALKSNQDEPDALLAASIGKLLLQAHYNPIWLHGRKAAPPLFMLRYIIAKGIRGVFTEGNRCCLCGPTKEGFLGSQAFSIRLTARLAAKRS